MSVPCRAIGNLRFSYQNQHLISFRISDQDKGQAFELSGTHLCLRATNQLRDPLTPAYRASCEKSMNSHRGLPGVLTLANFYEAVSGSCSHPDLGPTSASADLQSAHEAAFHGWLALSREEQAGDFQAFLAAQPGVRDAWLERFRRPRPSLFGGFSSAISISFLPFIAITLARRLPGRGELRRCWTSLIGRMGASGYPSSD